LLNASSSLERKGKEMARPFPKAKKKGRGWWALRENRGGELKKKVRQGKAGDIKGAPPSKGEEEKGRILLFR